MQNTQLTQVYGLNPEELIQQIAIAVTKLLEKDEPKEQSKVKTESILFTRSEAASYLQVSKATLNNWANLGIITKHKIGNLVRYKKSELDEALQVSKSKGTKTHQ